MKWREFNRRVTAAVFEALFVENSPRRLRQIEAVPYAWWLLLIPIAGVAFMVVLVELEVENDSDGI